MIVSADLRCFSKSKVANTEHFIGKEGFGDVCWKGDSLEKEVSADLNLYTQGCGRPVLVKAMWLPRVNLRDLL